MKIKTKPFQVDPANPFSNDVLNRRESAEILTELVKSLGEPFVLAIDAGWGRGKTTFIEQWSTMLQLDGFHTLKFNAWENDFTTDPLISFIGEMSNGLELSTSAKAKKEVFTEKLERTKDIGARILKRTLPAAAKLLTAGALDASEFSEGVMADAASSIVKDQIDSYAADKNMLAEFRRNLEEFITLVTDEGTDDRKPLIFFIDELDRCRPTYSVELLERLKHLFNVPGIAFVLALDKEQIGHSICSMYGERFDSNGYLRRFIDVDYRLPDPPADAYTKYLIQQYEFDTYFQVQNKHGCSASILAELFTLVATAFNLSLRDQDQIFSKLSIIFRTSKQQEDLFIATLLVLLALKHVKPNDYRDFTHQEISGEAVLELIQKSSASNNLFASRYAEYINIQLQHGFSDENRLIRLNDIQRNKLSSARANQSNPDTQRETELRSHAIEQMFRSDEIPLIPFLVRKIEISGRFTS